MLRVINTLKIMLCLFCFCCITQTAAPQARAVTGVAKKLSRSAIKSSTHGAEKTIAKKIVAKGFKRSSMNFADRAVGEQFIRKAAREKVCDLMEKQGIKSFLVYGNHMAAKEIHKTGVSISKRSMLSLSKRNGYKTRMVAYRKDARLNSTKTATKTVVKRSLKGKEALALLYKKNPEMKKVITELNKTFSWGDNYKVEELSDRSLVVTSINNNITKMKIKGNVISLEPGSTMKEGAMNQFANVILPNKMYKVGNGCFVYKTDKYARVVDAYGDRTKVLELPERNKIRNKDIQEKIMSEGIKGKDDGGHIFDCRGPKSNGRPHNGPNEKINQVPMNSYFNQHGEWKKLEKEEAKYIQSGRQVNSRRQLMYEGTSKRPYAIKVWLYVDKKIVPGYPKVLQNPA